MTALLKNKHHVIIQE